MPSEICIEFQEYSIITTRDITSITLLVNRLILSATTFSTDFRTGLMFFAKFDCLFRLSLKREFSGCDGLGGLSGFGGFDGLGRFRGFDGFVF